MKRSAIVTLSLVADVVAAGLLFLAVCLRTFLLPREQKALQVQTSDELSRRYVLPWVNRQSEYFSPEPVVTESSYAGPTAAVSLRTFSRRLEGEDAFAYHVADIRVGDVRCIRTALAHDAYGVGIQEPILDMMERNEALVAMNGDYYSYQSGGLVIRNGEVFRSDPSDAESCVLFRDGRMEIVPPGYNLDELICRGAWQAWTFGPSLLNAQGRAIRTPEAGKYLRLKHPRSAIGYIAPGHYCFVVCDGRQTGYSQGATLYALAQIMEGLGCRVAYNLDGGHSSVLAFRGAVWNSPSGEGREISDCVLVKEFVP